MDGNRLRVVGRSAKPVEDIPAEDLAEFFDFTDRESYLKWVAQWKESYKALADVIREQKNLTRNLQRSEDESASANQSLVDMLGFQARVMIHVRRTAKKVSWEMKQRAVSAVVSAAV